MQLYQVHLPHVRYSNHAICTDKLKTRRRKRNQTEKKKQKQKRKEWNERILCQDIKIFVVVACYDHNEAIGPTLLKSVLSWVSHVCMCVSTRVSFSFFVFLSVFGMYFTWIGVCACLSVSVYECLYICVREQKQRERRNQKRLSVCVCVRELRVGKFISRLQQTVDTRNTWQPNQAHATAHKSHSFFSSRYVCFMCVFVYCMYVSIGIA